MHKRESFFDHLHRYCVASTALVCCTAMTTAYGGDKIKAEAANSVVTSGLSLKELTQLPGVIFGHELSDVPGKNLVVVKLEFPPMPPQRSNVAKPCMAHRHPSSVYVYVTKGTMRLGVAGQPVQVVHAGQSFYEPAGALHTVAENASATVPAAAIAILILPNGAPILTPEQCGAP